MSRKVFLPLTRRLNDTLDVPTVDAMRKRLGGRTSTSDVSTLPAGSVVTVTTGAGTERLGVLVASDAVTAHVYLERGIVKRTRAADVAGYGGDAPTDLAAIARQVRVFATLVEGQDVHVEREVGRTQPGILREKCRYGALVELEDGRVLGVGFGKLWPASAPGPAGGAGAN
jgi:hypothetical protein